MSTTSLHTAICTWSGFVYQGKVALLHALQVLIDEGYLVAQNYQLQLDYLDDFAVLDGQENTMSLHQVKAYRSGHFSAYREAFKVQQEKESSIGCSNLYFHVASEIADKTSDDIANEYSPVKLYDYPQQGAAHYYCSLSDVDSEIEARIRTFFVNNHFTESYRIIDEYLTKCRCYLDQIIQEQVICIHAAVHAGTPQGNAASKKTISFSELLQVLNEDLTQRGLSENYFFWKLKLDLGHYYQMFCFDRSIVDQQADGEKLSEYMRRVNNLDKEELKRFIRSILPHRKARFSSLEEYVRDNFYPSEIQNAFFKILHELRESGDIPSLLFSWEANSSVYSPTAIIEGPSQRLDICERIMRNALDTDLNVCFEADKLVTIDIETEDIFQAASHILDQCDESDNNYQKISHWKKVALVTLAQAKDEIND